jgi:HD superfamily phosphodiesterase
MTDLIAGIRVPDSAMARAATQLVRDTEDDLLYNHSRRVFFWGALTGERKGLKYDSELLYIGAMFHDMGLTDAHSSPDLRFEVDGANAARNFLRSYGVPQHDIEDVWAAIALHTTPGIPEHMRPTIALALLWQIYSRCCVSLICLLQYGHRCGRGRTMSSTMAWRTAGRLG